jgi:two-component system, LytTR family, response regulator
VKALLIDDERLARVELRRLLRPHEEVTVVGEAANVEDALSQVETLSPDLLFLDIEMPGGTGFDLLERLEGSAPQVIFTTAYDGHALRAFEFNALDYLVKPVEPERLARAIERVQARVVVAAPTRLSLDRVFVRDGERCFFVQLDAVRLLESEGNYSRLYLEDRTEQPLLCRSLNYLEARLDPARFFRASRQHLVNLSAIRSLEPGPGGRLVLVLTGGQEIEMSRRQSQRFKERMAP